MTFDAFCRLIREEWPTTQVGDGLLRHVFDSVLLYCSDAEVRDAVAIVRRADLNASAPDLNAIRDAVRKDRQATSHASAATGEANDFTKLLQSVRNAINAANRYAQKPIAVAQLTDENVWHGYLKAQTAEIYGPALERTGFTSEEERAKVGERVYENELRCWADYHVAKKLPLPEWFYPVGDSRRGRRVVSAPMDGLHEDRPAREDLPFLA